MPLPPRRRFAPRAADFVLLAALAAAVPLSERAIARAAIARGATVDIEAAGGRRSVGLDRDATYRIAGPRGPTVLRVRDGAAFIDSTSCRDRLCARMGRLNGPGRVLVCLPNRIVVRVRGQAADVDAIVR